MSQGVYEFSLTFNKYHVDKSPLRIQIIEGGDGNKHLTKLPTCKLQEIHSREANLNLNQVFEKPSSTDYELNSLHTNNKFNTTLNKIMEESILDTENEMNSSIKPIVTELSDSSESSGGERKFNSFF